MHHSACKGVADGGELHYLARLIKLPICVEIQLSISENLLGVWHTILASSLLVHCMRLANGRVELMHWLSCSLASTKW